MAKHIESWVNTDTFEGVRASKGEYTTFEVTAIEKGDDYYDRDKGVTLSLYQHEESGILVRDISKFEAWLATVITR